MFFNFHKVAARGFDRRSSSAGPRSDAAGLLSSPGPSALMLKSQKQNTTSNSLKGVFRHLIWQGTENAASPWKIIVMLLSVAVCCRLLPSAAVCWRLLLSVAVCCRLLLSVALCCRLLPYVVVCCRLLLSVGVCWHLLPSFAVCCRPLSPVTLCCRLLPSVVVCCPLLPSVVGCCPLLSSIAVCCRLLFVYVCVRVGYVWILLWSFWIMFGYLRGLFGSIEVIVASCLGMCGHVWVSLDMFQSCCDHFKINFGPCWVVVGSFLVLVGSFLDPLINPTTLKNY